MPLPSEDNHNFGRAASDGRHLCAGKKKEIRRVEFAYLVICARGEEGGREQWFISRRKGGGGQYNGKS